jgi:hypothetical protein
VAQNLDVPSQLESDVAALMLEVFDDRGDPSACRETCAAGASALAVVLGQVKDHLDRNTLRVETLLVESHVTGARLAAAFERANLGTYLYAQGDAVTWPTLQALVQGGTRLGTCRTVNGRNPTFVAVDFVDVGGLPATLRQLNAGRRVQIVSGGG